MRERGRRCSMSNRTSIHYGKLSVKTDTGDMIPAIKYPELRETFIRLAAFEQIGYEPEELKKIIESANFLAYAMREVKR